MSTEATLGGNRSDAVIYQEEFFGGMYEVIQQNAEVFNQNSNGAMILRPRAIQGDFEKESFFKHIENMIQDRDPDSNATVDDLKMTMDEMIRVKVNKRIGPLAQSRDFFLKIGQEPRLMSFVLGQMYGEQVLQDYVNTGILCTSTALEAQGSLTYDYVAAGGASTTMDSVTPLIRGNALLGDKSQRIRAYIMHSKVFHDLMEGQASGGFTNVADVIIYGGTPGTLGKPVIVTDSPELKIDGSAGGSTEDSYITLGLVDAALEVAVSEGEYVTMQEITGQENIMWRLQGEFAYNVGVKGFKYTGVAKPTDTALGSTGNWSFVLHSEKLAAGTRIITN